MKVGCLSSATLESLWRLSGSVVASSIETLRVRLPNTGFTDSSIHRIFDERPPMVGYAATVRIRTSEPPMEGRSYYKNTEWWNHILTVAEPRVVFIEDLDDPPGRGAFVGETHARILKALGCVGIVTNGTVRDVDSVQLLDFQMFAQGFSVSHAFAHVFDFGSAVSIAGMTVEPGSLIHGDELGVQTIPLEIAAKIPGTAEAILRSRQQFNELCRPENFSIDKLREAVHKTEDYKK
jgi:4-hydroxy-4-methyl-2-oxoglutarate aldolase